MTTWLLAVTTMAFVMSASPGPNNVLFVTSGARIGYWKTLPVGHKCAWLLVTGSHATAERIPRISDL